MIKTLAMTPGMANPTLKTLKPDSVENSLCYQIFSFDFILDEKMTPYLIEVNDLPNMKIDNAIEGVVKR